VKFGLSLSGWQRGGADADMTARAGELLEHVRLAEELGFDYVSLGQHYLTHPYQMLQPMPLLGRMIAETGQLGLVVTLVAPLHNPLDLAENLATLDVLSGGRVTLTLALGYREPEYAAFGVRHGQRVRRMREVVECLLRLWGDEPVTVSSDRFELREARSGVRPAQKPRPPLWIAANADPAIERAARWGLPWRINSHAAFATIERQVALYRQAYIGTDDPQQVTLPLGRELYCAASREKAFEIAEPPLAANYRRYADWGQDRALPGKEDFRIPYEELASDRFIVGDPADCRAALRRYARLGIGHVTLRMAWPGMDRAHSLEGMRVFAAEVMPELREG
jgi:alkanesulfonate monooxygenase SsuD/methylene tetrahydromethanopterin reductase-like flavin-dependent oxidoreductase (luciferase family)